MTRRLPSGWWRRESARQILSLAVALPVATAVGGGTAVGVLVTWDGFACAYLLLTFLALRGRDPREIREIVRSAQRRSALARLVVSSPDQLPQVAAAVALLATVSVIPRSDEFPLATAVVVGLCAVAVVSAWLTLQVGFGISYAAEHSRRGGLEFPGHDTDPQVTDFAYFAVVVGTGCGTGDVAVTRTAMRRRVLVHTALAFAFNALIIATAVGFVTTQLASG